jgi:hypothetical protein
LRGFAPHGHWRTLTFVGALHCDRLTAPCVSDRPINGECFRTYVEQQLVPVLRQEDIVVWDNLGSHKSAVRRWRRRFEAKGVDGLIKDAARPPRRKPLSAARINQVVHMTLNETPPTATVPELNAAIMEYLDNHNAEPKPFAWTKSAGEILEKVANAKQALKSVH